MLSRIRNRILIAAVATLGCDRDGHQAIPEVELGPAQWVLEVAGEPQVAVSNTLVAVSAPGERSVLFLDEGGDTVDTFGRAGEGPGEFGMPARPYRLDGGRWAFVDPALHRITIVDSARQFIEVQPVPAPHDPFTVHIARDGVFASLIAHSSSADSAVVIRTRPGSSGFDTVATLHRPAAVLVPLGEIAINTPPEYAAHDSWGLADDGGVWIARGDDNRIDLYPIVGPYHRGNAVRFARIPTNDADRRLWRGMPAPERLLKVPERPIAHRKAPFQEVRRAGDGEFWLWLNQTSGYATEVFACRTSESQELLRVRLPSAHKIVGLSTSQVFVYREAVDGMVALSAHARSRCDGRLTGA